MNYNEYNEVINGNDTYRKIAEALKKGEAIGIGWTDEIYTHLDIVFKLGIEKYGCFQRGIRSDYLYISIIDHTSYAFRTDSVKHEGYIMEKLRINDECGSKLADLINGIIEELVGV